MAKVSISSALRNVRRIRFLTILCSLVLVFLLFELLIIKNPRSSKASSLSCDEHIIGNDINNCPDGSNVVIDGVTATISGKHKFKNLTIKNGGVLTHDAVQISEIDPKKDPLDLNSGYLSATALDKKVDLEVEGSVILETSDPLKISKIDVSGKGYPGNNGQADGFGPGRGKDSGEYGGGAGFGGAGGGDHHGEAYPANPSTTIFDPTQFYFGSSGGPADADCGADSEHVFPFSGAGGGRIYIKAGKISIGSGSGIYANGSQGGNAESWWSNWFDSCHKWAHSGGGAGGFIWLEANDFSFLNILDTVTYNGAENYGNIGSYNHDVTASGIHAEAGTGGWGRGGPGGGGGGGRIVIKKNESRFIKKTLTPISRISLNGSNQFNPYAVESGDVIQVNIIVSGLEANKTYDIKDNILKLPNGTKKCVPVPGTFTSLPDSNSTGIYDDIYYIVVWNDFISTTFLAEGTFSYKCQVN